MGWATVKDIDPEFLRKPQLSDYWQVCERRIEDFMRDPEDPIPFYRIGRSVRFKRSEVDEWLRRRFRVDRTNKVDEIVNDVLRDFNARC